MYDYTGWIVQANAGRDKDGIFCVVGVDQEGHMLLLADGKRRRLCAPKKKRRSHVQPLGTSDHPVFARLRAGCAVGDGELRKALAVFREGGNHAWQKTI